MMSALHKKQQYFRLSFFWSLACAIALAMLAGCGLMSKPPSVQLPKDLPTSWAAEVAIENLPITEGLLDLLDETPVKELVREALRNNPDLHATALRLQAADYLLSAPRSRMLPALNARLSSERDNQGTAPETGRLKTENTHRLSLMLSWELDLWGRLADEYAASEQEVIAQEHHFLQARDALAARVIQTWIEQVALRRSLAIQEERLAVLQRIETLLVNRYKKGIGSQDEFSTARSRTEIAKADVSALRAAWLQTIRTLEILLGRYPKGEWLEVTDLPTVTTPIAPTPATALLNRPDIQAAVARAEMARYVAAAAQKALLPELRLSGILFKESAELGGVGGSSSYWNILGALFQPLFEGGRIINESQARRSEAKAALLELRQVVLQALKEAEDAFDLEHELAAQADALKAATRESEKSSRYFVKRYRQGLDNLQTLLIAKEQEMAVKVRHNGVIAGRLKNRVDLALALGMGLDNESVLAAGDTMP